MLDLRARSLLVTVFGDALAPRGQNVWLGSLIGLLEPFGLSARLVRTSVFRLTAEGWFVGERDGRRSYYGLTDEGRLRMQHADNRIYAFDPAPWDGAWTLVLLDRSLRASDRLRLQRELMWESFGRLSPHVFAHPQANHRSLAEIIGAAGAQDRVAVMQARELAPFAGGALQSVVYTTFALARTEQAWQQFVARFGPLQADVPLMTPAEAFVARTLLIHEYRRVLLRDPGLPRDFLPANWPGMQARRLCEALYGGLLRPSEKHLRASVLTADGALAPTPRAITRRLRGRTTTGN